MDVICEGDTAEGLAQSAGKWGNTSQTRSSTPDTRNPDSAGARSDASSDRASDHGSPGGSPRSGSESRRPTWEEAFFQKKTAGGVTPTASKAASRSSNECWSNPPQRMSDVRFTTIQGVKYPAFFRENEVLALKQSFRARAGDVFVVSNFPIWGLQRLMVALVEGRDDPWAQDLLDRPYYCDAAASRRGAKTYLELADSWTQRRCFKTHAFPSLFPCRYPFDDVEVPAGEVPPKVIVLLADPRNYLTMFWSFFIVCSGMDISFAEFLEQYLEGGGNTVPFGAWPDFVDAWSHEAELHPESVRLFNGDRLGSLDPKEFVAELSPIASFLSIPMERVSRLAEGVFRRPAELAQGPLDWPSLSQEDRHLREAVKAGHLIEQSARNKYIFEDTLSQVSFGMTQLWRQMLVSAAQSKNPCVIEMAQSASKGVLSLPPVAMTQVLKGDAAHNAGVCRPCVFALRGVCKESEAMCLYCHDPSHPKTKRASRKKRAQRKALHRIRTPSPGDDWD